jgi:hypothetical protein
LLLSALLLGIWPGLGAQGHRILSSTHELW